MTLARWRRPDRAGFLALLWSVACLGIAATAGPSLVLVPTATGASFLEAAATGGTAGTGLVGHWTGHWLREGDSLAVWFDFVREDTVIAGTFGSDALRAIGIPLRSVHYAEGRAHFELVGDATTTVFDGVLEGETLQGAFSDGRSRGTFQLRRTREAPGPPYSREEARFTNHNVTLSGTFFLPSGQGPHPAVLFLHGSGPEGRYANQYLADRFARAGIAALIYDKRGVGKSSGDWKQSTFEDLAGDAIAGLNLLKQDGRIRRKAIGIFGHSQGGTIAPLVASRWPDVAFVIASAPSGVSMGEAERYSLLNSAGASKLSPPDSARAARYVDLVIQTAYYGAPRAALDSTARADSSASWFFAPPPLSSHYWTFSRLIADYDPLRYWKEVRAPVLLLFGEKDQRIPVTQGASNIRSALAGGGNRRVTIKIFSEADHTFRLRAQEGKFRWPRTAEGYLRTQLDWVRAQIGLRAKS